MDVEAVVGPQRRSEPWLMRRTRFHQSWFRAHVLGLPRWGSTPGANGRPLGSVLHPVDAAAGLNFTSPAARALYETRRLEGWGVDPVRCTSLLTSSQALTLNLFGPLIAHRELLAETVGVVSGRSDVTGVKDVWVEFAPRRRSQFLKDMTRLDVLVYAETATGVLPVIFEVKYADRFNSRQTPTATAPYRALADRTGVWRDGSVLVEPRFNQLVRCHALGAAASEADGASALPVIVVVHLDEDTGTAGLVDDYRTHVSDPALVRRVTLPEFVASMGSAGTGLCERYCDISASESDWESFSSRSSKSRVSLTSPAAL